MTEIIFRGTRWIGVVKILKYFYQDSEGRIRKRLYPELPETPVHAQPVRKQVTVHPGPEGRGGPT